MVASGNDMLAVTILCPVLVRLLQKSLNEEFPIRYGSDVVSNADAMIALVW